MWFNNLRADYTRGFSRTDEVNPRYLIPKIIITLVNLYLQNTVIVLFLRNIYINFAENNVSSNLKLRIVLK